MKPKTGYIYILTNILNDKSYVGQTQQKLSYRLVQHKRLKKDPNMAISRAVKKYGFDNFEVEVFDNIPVCDLDKFEIFLIDRLDTFSMGYNCTIGGEGGSTFDKSKYVGTKHNKLLILDAWSDSNRYYATVKCDCGTIKNTSLHGVISEDIKACGCLISNAHKDVGNKYGRLIVNSIFYHKNKASANVICDCGTKKTVRLGSLRSGLTQSCGCLQKEAALNNLKKIASKT